MTADLDAAVEFSELDQALADQPIAPPSLTGATGRKCRRHEWIHVTQPMFSEPFAICKRCHLRRDETRARRGKSSRRLGNDQERRAERVYGWEKIGERGQLTDLRGTLFKVQQKASRRAAPALFRAIFPGLDASKDGRVPLLLLSFVTPSVGTEDYIVVRGRDWLDLHGRDE